MAERERDRGRKYQSGAAKRKESIAAESEQNKLPKITSWLKSTTATVGLYNEQANNAKGNIATTTSALSAVGPAPCFSAADASGDKNSNDSASECGSEVDSETAEDYEKDIGLWPDQLPEKFRNYWIEKGSAQCRNVDSDYKNSAVRDGNKTRHCTKNLFSRKHTLSGEEIDLSWLCYSEETGRLFCFICRLMSPMSDTKSRFTSGFQDWKRARESIEGHSNSDQHKQAMSSLASRKSLQGRVNAGLVRQYESERHYWHEVLRRCVDVLMFLCERGLPIRGDDEVIGSVHNGNYLGVMELLSKYDTFLAAHLHKHANKGSGNVNYLSSTVCNELINVLGRKVLSAIVAEVRRAKYYSISVDSTPDVSHTDQLCLTIRYVLPEGPVERFLTFVPLLNHTRKEIADVVLDFLQTNKIPISDCRGQSYDNASNMSGKYRGIQAHLKSRCEFAEFVPCMAHSLNLIGMCAAECCTAAVTLFGIVQRLYVYLVKSTYRWRKHRDALKHMPVVKCLSDTRWSARADAVEALANGFQQNIMVLDDLAMDEHLNAEAKNEASAILKELEKLETVILLVTWQEILKRFNATSQQLQKPGLDLNTAVKLLESLTEFVQDLRERFDDFEHIAIDKCGHSEYEDDRRRVRRRKRHHDEVDSADDTQLPPRERFRTTSYIPIIDQLTTSLGDRLKAYGTLRQRFSFFSEITTIQTDKLRDSAADLVKSYLNDLEPSLVSEIVHFQAFLKTMQTEDSEKLSETTMFSTIHNYDMVAAFANVEIALRVYLSMFVTNCTGERSFSKLKRIKNYLRSTIGQDRLASLAILSAEHELFRRVSTRETIEDFARIKARKKLKDSKFPAMGLRLMLYEAQFFDFTPHLVMDGLANILQEFLFGNLQACEQFLFAHLPPGVTKSEVRTGTERLLQQMQKKINTIFPHLELFLLKHVLTVPSTVLLPEDAVHAHNPATTPTIMAPAVLLNQSLSQEMEQALDAEIAELRQQYRDLTTVMAKLQAEREDQRRIEHLMKTALQRDDELMSCFQKCQFPNPGLTFSSCLEQAHQLCTQIEQGQEQADAIGLSIRNKYLT